jgi:hypothetical protein
MSEDKPVRIDRAALDRIIQRAAELQTAEKEIGDNLTSDEVLALGREVGIPGRYLQQALLEESTRLANLGPSGLWERLVGPGQVTAQRVVRGEPEAVERTLVEWLEEFELLCVLRRQAGRVSFEPQGGIQAAIRRATGFGSNKRPIMLSKADTVSAAVLGLEPGWCHVVLTAVSRRARMEHTGGGIAFAGAGAAATTLMVVLGAVLPVALIPIPIGLGIGYGFTRRYPPVVERIRLGLERVLDHLEQGAVKPEHQLGKPRLMDLLADEVRKALKG